MLAKSYMKLMAEMWHKKRLVVILVVLVLAVVSVNNLVSSQ